MYRVVHGKNRWGDSLAIGRIARERSDGLCPLGEEVSRLYDELHQPIYRYLLRLLGNSGDAEDLLQETFLRLYTELRDRNNVRNVRSWLFRVAHNLAVDRQRQLGDSDSFPWVALDASHQEVAGAGLSAEQQLLRAETDRNLETALSWLSPQQRQCLEMRAEGLRYREIADVMGIQISTVRTFIVRAVAKIAGKANG